MIFVRAPGQRGRMALAAIVLFLATSASFCVPSDYFYGPVAIRATSDGGIEAQNVPCDEPSMATEFWLARPADAGDEPENQSETVWVWRVVFDQPTTVDRVVLGEVPPGANEAVPWPEDGLESFPADTLYTAKFDLDELGDRSESFRLSDLEDGRIRFQDQNMTPDEFAEADPCLR